MLLPGIIINTGPTDFAPIRQAQMRRFDGERYVPFGPVLSGEIAEHGPAVATRSATADARPAPLN